MPNMVISQKDPDCNTSCSIPSELLDQCSAVDKQITGIVNQLIFNAIGCVSSLGIMGIGNYYLLNHQYSRGIRSLQAGVGLFLLNFFRAIPLMKENRAARQNFAVLCKTPYNSWKECQQNNSCNSKTEV